MAALIASGPEELELDLLLEALYQRHGYDFRGYERRAVRARVHRLMAQRALRTVSQLQDQVLHDAQASAALLRLFASPGTPMFDDPGQGPILRRAIVASLGGCALPRVWLPECRGAEEAWSLAIVLEEQRLLAHTEIFATAANEQALADMQGASIPVERLAEYQENYLKSGGRASLADHLDISGKRATLRRHLQQRITWSQYNLVTDASFNEFALIVNGSALDEFGPVLRQRVLRLFHDSLARFGVLGLGTPLLTSDAIAPNYRALDQAQPWYKRII